MSGWMTHDLGEAFNGMGGVKRGSLNRHYQRLGRERLCEVGKAPRLKCSLANERASHASQHTEVVIDDENMPIFEDIKLYSTRPKQTRNPLRRWKVVSFAGLFLL